MPRAEKLPDVVRYGHAEFLDDVWRYRPGEHVTLLAPTGNGKTHLTQELLDRSATPENPSVCLIAKPRDVTVKGWVKRSGHKVVTTWPVPPTPFQYEKPPGYVLWPRHRFDPALDDPEHHRIFRAAILDSYKRGKRITFCDETVGLQGLGLTGELETVWRQGRSMENGLWASSQAPIDISTYAYSQAQHMFLGYIGDKKKRERLGEISGVDEQLVRYVVARLRKYEWLYLRVEDRTMCIIEK